MMDQDADILSGHPSVRKMAAIGLLLCVIFGVLTVIHIFFFSPLDGMNLVWSLNFTCLIPLISFWAIVFCVWLFVNAWWTAAARAVTVGSMAASLYACWLLHRFHERWLADVYHPDISLAVTLGIAFGLVLLRMAVLALAPLGPSVTLRGVIVVASLPVMVATGFAAHVTPMMLAADYQLGDLPRRDMSSVGLVPGIAAPMVVHPGLSSQPWGARVVCVHAASIGPIPQDAAVVPMRADPAAGRISDRRPL